MMATIIILGSVALGTAYALLWWLRPSLRRQIEAPSHRFAADARAYDEARCPAGAGNAGKERGND